MNTNGSVIIVLVSDNSGHAPVLEKYLTRERPGDCLVPFDDGMQAVEFLVACEGQPTVVLLLRTLANDGHKVIRAIKMHQRLRRIPVIAFLDGDDPVEVVRHYDAGGNLCLTTPADESHWADTTRLLGSMISFVSIPR